MISEFIRPLQLSGDKPEQLSVKPTFLSRSRSGSPRCRFESDVSWEGGLRAEPLWGQMERQGRYTAQGIPHPSTNTGRHQTHPIFFFFFLQMDNERNSKTSKQRYSGKVHLCIARYRYPFLPPCAKVMCVSIPVFFLIKPKAWTWLVQADN